MHLRKRPENLAVISAFQENRSSVNEDSPSTVLRTAASAVGASVLINSWGYFLSSVSQVQPCESISALPLLPPYGVSSGIFKVP